ncbi:MAG: hypothetical protein ABR601_00465 [Parasphingopyxis sp.]|nr:hypothetical protein [Sphingomonadales bacterium]
MKIVIFWLVALLALAFNLFAVWDLWGTLSNFESHLAGYPPELVAMMRDIPEWRIVMWATTVFIGVIGALLLALRRAMAERVLWTATALMLAGLVIDYTMFDGARGYGPNGIFFNALIVGIEALFALYARWAARHGLLR